MWLLDTNVVSELRRATVGRADRNVVAWATGVVPEHLYLSSITILELEIGVLSLGRRDARQSAVLRLWLDTVVLKEFKSRILPLDVVVAKACAALHVPDPRGERNAIIAATALVHGLVVVTRDVRDFEPMGVAVINPWLA